MFDRQCIPGMPMCSTIEQRAVCPNTVLCEEVAPARPAAWLTRAWGAGPAGLPQHGAFAAAPAPQPPAWQAPQAQPRALGAPGGWGMAHAHAGSAGPGWAGAPGGKAAGWAPAHAAGSSGQLLGQFMGPGGHHGSMANGNGALGAGRGSSAERPGDLLLGGAAMMAGPAHAPAGDASGITRESTFDFVGVSHRCISQVPFCPRQKCLFAPLHLMLHISEGLLLQLARLTLFGCARPLAARQRGEQSHLNVFAQEHISALRTNK